MAGRTQSYRLGDWLIEPALNRLSNDATEQHLEGKAMDVLVELLEASGEVVTVDELLDRVWADRVVESSTVHRRINQIRRALGDEPRDPTYIRTVIRRGYQTVAPVVVLDGDGAGAASSSAVTKPSIAVLPFANRSSDPEVAYLCEGIALELITGLTKIDELVVASALSSFRHREQQDDIAAIRDDLKCEFLLTGSVQKSGERLRVTVALTATADATVVWSDRYDGGASDVFELQEDVARRVVRATSGEMALLSSPIIAPGTSNPDAYHSFLHGLHEFDKGTGKSYMQAQQWFQSAIDLDSGYGRCIWYAFINATLARDGGAIGRDEYQAKAERFLALLAEADFEAPMPPFHVDRLHDPKLMASTSEREFALEALAAIADDDPAWRGYGYAALGDALVNAGLVNGACAFYEHYLDRYTEHAKNTEMSERYGDVLFALGRFEKAIEFFSGWHALKPSNLYFVGHRAMLYSRTERFDAAAEDLKILSGAFRLHFPAFYDHAKNSLEFSGSVSACCIGSLLIFAISALPLQIRLSLLVRADHIERLAGSVNGKGAESEAHDPGRKHQYHEGNSSIHFAISIGCLITR